MIEWEEFCRFFMFSVSLPGVMQFTGLHDKNGKEIYEGDIIQHSHDGTEPRKAFEVFWDAERASFSMRNSDGYWPGIETRFQVIGNIYENPELLKS